MKIRLWFIRETEKARLYSKTPPDREQVEVWIPRSVVDHTSKNIDGTHIVDVQDWFAEKEDL